MEISSPYQDRRKDITSLSPWRQQAGIELVENRLVLARILDCDNVVLHIPFPEEKHQIISVDDPFMQNLFHAMDAIWQAAEREGVCIAVENLQNTVRGTEFLLESLFDRYPKEYIGWCYDSGHAHNVGLDFDTLSDWKDRMVAMHLHDNWGATDDHLLPGDGSINWDRVARLIAESAYELPLTYETPPERYSLSTDTFYEKAYSSIVSMTDKVIAAYSK
jgi:sugar phosphate isomerase/epimerase